MQPIKSEPGCSNCGNKASNFDQKLCISEHSTSYTSNTSEQKFNKKTILFVDNSEKIEDKVEGIDNYLNFAIPIILVILGWRFLYLNAKKIATRSESKSLIDSIIKIIDEIDKEATNFWLSPRVENSMSHEHYLMLVMSKFEVLMSRIDDLEKRKVLIEKKKLSTYYSQLTLNCEFIDSIPITECMNFTQSALDSSRQIASDLFNEFDKVYKPTYKISENFFFFSERKK